MKLLKLQIENFRNYTNYEHNFGKNPGTTVITGLNGHGKTNLLEAIYVLSLGKSFRSILQDDLINWNADYFKIIGHTEDIELEVFYSGYPQKQKVFKKNGVKIKHSEYIGNFITVLFHPEDLNMLYLSPELRRRYLDILLSQLDKKYLSSLSKYQKILRQRSALLIQIREQEFKSKSVPHELLNDLNSWDEEMLENGSYIVKKRLEFVDYLKENLENIYNVLADKEHKITLFYKSTWAENHAETLQKNRKRDIFSAKNTTGPHRDDLEFSINDRKIASAASRGEFRTLMIALKMAEIAYIKKITGEVPLLLLDDVFSELDSVRQKMLLKAIDGAQTIITTTDIHDLDNVEMDKSHIDIVSLA